jgi:kynurenine formamidase
MCSPVVINEVHQEFSRRRFISATAFGAAGAVIAGDPASAQQQQKPVRLPNGFRDVYDLTHTFSGRLPVFPAFKPVQIRQRFDYSKDGFFANEVTFDEHTGTHMDAPLHFIAGGLSADRLPPERLIAPLAVVSIAARAAKDPDTLVTVDDLLAWEKRHGRLPVGAVVAMHCGWDMKNMTHAPGFGEAAARFLIDQRDIVGVGVDTLSLDAAVAPKFVAHLVFLGAGKYGLELLANLGTVPPAGTTIIVGAPKHEGASGGPIRALALA